MNFTIRKYWQKYSIFFNIKISSNICCQSQTISTNLLKVYFYYTDRCMAAWHRCQFKLLVTLVFDKCMLPEEFMFLNCCQMSICQQKVISYSAMLLTKLKVLSPETSQKLLFTSFLFSKFFRTDSRKIIVAVLLTYTHILPHFVYILARAQEGFQFCLRWTSSAFISFPQNFK